jgi:hypothetical protein
VRRPLKTEVKGIDEWTFQFKSHFPGKKNRVTIRVTESEKDGKLMIDVENVEGTISLRRARGEGRGR